MNLKELSDTIRDFRLERKWENSDPNQLISSILIEFAELAEHYQWKNEFEKFDDEKKKEVAFEFVDVLVYLLTLAHKSGIDDIEPYFKEKIVKLAKKFPVGINDETWRKNHEEYRATGKNKTYDD